jgi:hypothetical protein
MLLTLRDGARSLAWATTILLFGYSTTFFDGASCLRHQYQTYRTDSIKVKDGFSRTYTQGTGVIQGNEKVNVGEVNAFTEENSISTTFLLLHYQRYNLLPLFAYRGNKYVSPVMEDRLKRGLLTSADLDRYHVGYVNLRSTMNYCCRGFCLGLFLRLPINLYFANQNVFTVRE